MTISHAIQQRIAAYNQNVQAGSNNYFEQSLNCSTTKAIWSSPSSTTVKAKATVTKVLPATRSGSIRLQRQKSSTLRIVPSSSVVKVTNPKRVRFDVSRPVVVIPGGAAATWGLENEPLWCQVDDDSNSCFIEQDEENNELEVHKHGSGAMEVVSMEEEDDDEHPWATRTGSSDSLFDEQLRIAQERERLRQKDKDERRSKQSLVV